MSIVSEIIAELTAQVSGTFRIIGRAGDLAALKDGLPAALPALYVFVSQEASDENKRATGRSLQLTHLDVALVIVTRNVADARQGAAAEDIEELKAAALAAIVGWQPASASGLIEAIGGEMVKAAAGAVWWEHTVGVSFFLRGRE